MSENLDYRYDVKAYKEYLQDWLSHQYEKEYLDYGVMSFQDFWGYDIDYDFEDYDKALKIIEEHQEKKQKNFFENGGKGSGNFGHSGRPGQIGGSGAGGDISKSNIPAVDNIEISNEDIQKVSDDLWDIVSSNKETEAFDGLMEASGWTKSQNGWTMDSKIHSFASKPAEGEITGFNNGKKWLVDRNEENYSSNFTDEDSPGIYMMDSMKGESGYLDKKSGGVVALYFNPKNFTSDKNLDKLREKVSKQVDAVKSKTLIPDSLLASMFGYEGIRRKTSDSGYEYMTWNPSILKYHRSSLNENTSELISKIDKLLNGGKGSGNFGHLGRPGKVGGSSSKGTSVSSDLSDYWNTDLSPEEREAARKRLMDKWAKERAVREKYNRMRKLEKFTPEFEQELRDAGYKQESIDIMKARLAKKEARIAAKQEATKALKDKNNTPARNKAIEGIESKIAGFESESDEKWFKSFCSEEAAVALNNELDHFKKEYGLDTSLITLRCRSFGRKSGMASFLYNSYASTLSIDKKVLQDFVKFENTTGADAAKINWWTTGEAAGVIRHELGHIAAYQSMRKAQIVPRSWGVVNNYIVRRAIYNMIGAKNTPVTGVANNLLSPKQLEAYLPIAQSRGSGYMSRYGTSNTKEMVAESFANPNYSKLTKEIVKVVKKGYTVDDVARAYGTSGSGYQLGLDKIKYRNELNMEEEIEGCTGMPASEEEFYALGLTFDKTDL